MCFIKVKATLSSNRQHSQKSRRLSHSNGNSKENQLSFYSPTSRKLLISGKLKHCLFIATQIGFPDTKTQYNTTIREYKEMAEELNLSNDYQLILFINYSIQFIKSFYFIDAAPPNK